MTETGAKVLGAYCERGFDPSFWAEPLNAVTNAAFVVAGVVALRSANGDRGVAALSLVTIAIGVGSFLFHTLATRWALIADVAPIQAFIALYFLLAMRRFLGFGLGAALVVTLAFMAAAAVLPGLLPREAPWQGLGGYLGGFLGLLGVGLALVLKGGQTASAGRRLLVVAALFLLSLGFRTIDGAVCETLATGTHLLWHLLNALVLFTLMAILRQTSPRIRPNLEVG